MRCFRNVLFMVLMLFLCFSVAADQKNRITVTSACEYDYPPFCIVHENGKADGFSVELLTAALKAMNRDVTYAVDSWEKIKQNLADGKIEVLPLVSRTPEREGIFDFTFPYIAMHGSIVVRKEENRIKSLEDLKEYHIAVLKGDNSEEFLLRNGYKNLHTVSSFKDALNDLSQGHCDAVVIQKLLALQLIKENNIQNLKFAGPPLQDNKQSFCFAVREGNKSLLEILNEGLSIVIADGTFDTLHKKWFGPIESDFYERRRIVLGGDKNYPPYEFLDSNNKPTGFNVELSYAVARHMGIAVDIELGTWANVRKKLGNGSIDAVQGLFYSVERNREFDFTPPYTTVSHVIVSRPDSRIHEISALSGKKIAVMNGDIMHDWIISQNFEKIMILADDQEHALQLVAEKKADCALTGRLPALYWIRKHSWQLYVEKKAIIAPELCYGVLHDNEALLSKFTEGLAAVKNSGEYRKIYSKWFGVYEEQRISFREMMRYLLLITGPVLLLFIFSVFWTHMLKKRVDEKTEALSKEIEERKKTEEELKNSENRYRIQFENSGNGIAIHELISDENNTPADLVFIDINSEFEKMTGKKQAEVVGKRATEIFPVPETPMMIKQLGDVALNGVTVSFEQYFSATKQYFLVNAYKIGKNRVASTLTDITESKMLNNRFRQFFSNISQYAFMISPEEKILDLNNAALNCLGYSKEELIDTHIQIIYAPESQEKMQQLLKKWKETGTIHNEEMQIQTRSGEHRTILLNVSTAYDEQGAILHSISLQTDITELKKYQEEFQKAQKLESIGILAGGIAHDFNNLLGGIYGQTELAMAVSDSEKVKERLQKVMNTIDRASDLTRQLLTFSKGGSPNRKADSLIPFIEETVRFALSGSSVGCEFNIHPDLYLCRYDSNQMAQVIDNIVINAVQAMNAQGTITISAQNEYIPENNEHLLACGNYVKISVADTGTGISPEIISQVFDPFFSTKEAGSGLGLATSYSIVKRHEGILCVESEPGEKTVFHIHLPAAVFSDRKEGSDSKLRASYQGKILYMDDEEQLCEVAEEMLIMLGYEVVCVCSGKEAVDEYRSHFNSGVPFDAVLLDLTIPGRMGGAAAMKEICKIDPSAKGIVTSGYSSESNLNFTEMGFLDCIAKPYTKHKLEEVLYRVLHTVTQ